MLGALEQECRCASTTLPPPLEAGHPRRAVLVALCADTAVVDIVDRMGQLPEQVITLLLLDEPDVAESQLVKGISAAILARQWRPGQCIAVTSPTTPSWFLVGAWSTPKKKASKFLLSWVPVKPSTVRIVNVSTYQTSADVLIYALTPHLLPGRETRVIIFPEAYHRYPPLLEQCALFGMINGDCCGDLSAEVWWAVDPMPFRFIDSTVALGDYLEQINLPPLFVATVMFAWWMENDDTAPSVDEDILKRIKSYRSPPWLSPRTHPAPLPGTEREHPRTGPVQLACTTSMGTGCRCARHVIVQLS